MNMRFKLFGHTVTVIKEENREKLALDGIWITKTGHRMKVSEMDDNHLMNTIRMKERIAVAKIYGMGFKPGEYQIKTLGRDAFDSEPINIHLVDEARRRIRHGSLKPFTVVGMEVK